MKRSEKILKMKELESRVQALTYQNTALEQAVRERDETIKSLNERIETMLSLSNSEAMPDTNSMTEEQYSDLVNTLRGISQ